MLKRTKLYLLVTLLVLTGFAGSLHTGSISGNERRLLVSTLRSSRNAILNEIKDLSPNQMNWKAAGPSIRQQFDFLLQAELETAKHTRIFLHQEGQREKSSNGSADKTTIADLNNFRLAQMQGSASCTQRITSMKECRLTFTDTRNSILRFSRTTTDDLRTYTSSLGSHSADLYQLLLAHAKLTHLLAAKIAAIKTHPEFPRS